MASLGSASITIEIEPVVKLRCANTECVHNLRHDGYDACNLKWVELDEKGRCTNLASRMKVGDRK